MLSSTQTLVSCPKACHAIKRTNDMSREPEMIKENSVGAPNALLNNTLTKKPFFVSKINPFVTGYINLFFHCCSR